ncbi:MAG TPA: OmpA family protein, partial [Saprospiraceae bacterium]|nr:OmpA family protein [Saprospiraceae bacterium]
LLAGWVLLCTIYYFIFMQERLEHEIIKKIDVDMDRCLTHRLEPAPLEIVDETGGYSIKLRGNIHCKWKSAKPEFYCRDQFRSNFTNLKHYLEDHPDKALRINGNYSKEEYNQTELGDLGYTRAEVLRQYLIDSMGYRIEMINIGTGVKETNDLIVLDKMLYRPYVLTIEDIITFTANSDLEYVQPIYFDFDFRSLIPSDSLLNYLGNIASKYKNKKSYLLTITGHTDYMGSNEYNMKLGMDRAKFIEALIQEKFNYQNTVCRSEGEENPKYDNSTSQGRRMNRRVDLQIEKTE